MAFLIAQIPQELSMAFHLDLLLAEYRSFGVKC